MKYFSCIIIALLISATAIAANEKNTSTLVMAKGKCSLKIGTAPSTKCTQLIYMHFAHNGRAQFTAPTDVGAIAFSGGKDIQTSSENYTLLVDRLLNGRGDGTSVPIQANGKCQMKVSTSGEYIHSVRCTVQTEFGPALLNFEGNGSKVILENLPPL